MPDADLEIQTLRVKGMSRSDASRFADAIANHLSASTSGVSDPGSRQLGRIEIAAHNGETTDELARRVAAAILRAMQ